MFKEYIFDTLTPDADANIDLDSDTADPSMSSSSQYVSTNPNVFSYKRLNDQNCDMNLCKESSKLLVSRLKEKNLDCGTKVSFYHKKKHGLILYFICERASYSYRSPEL